MKKQNLRKVFFVCFIIALIYIQIPSVCASAQTIVGGDIVVDGFIDDWDNVSSRTSGDSYISDWKVAVGVDGTLFFYFTGTAVSEWDSTYMWKTLSIIQNGVVETRQIGGDWSFDKLGATTVMKNNANGNSAAPYIVEMSIPASYFTSQDYSITFAGVTVQSTEIERMNGESIQEEEVPVYEGIVMDGSFADWKAVKKVEVSCPNPAHPNCIILVSAVFDGDYVYLYMKDGEGGNAAGAGTHSNGKYSIVTDLGHELLFQLTWDGGISGIPGAMACRVGAEWEIAIPRSALPYYKESIAFGLYQTEAFIDGLVDLQGNGSNIPDYDGEESDEEIVYDGKYADWNTYPHKRIHYATAGTTGGVVDALGALFVRDTTLLSHVITTMPEHISEGGGEFAYGVIVRFNEDDSSCFGVRLVGIDSAGNINWNPKISGLGEGNYEFGIVSLDAWGTSSNISNVNDADRIYGKMHMTLRESYHEMEYYLDLEKIADKLQCDVDALKMIEVMYARIGQQWLATAGADTGAWLGIMLCVLVVWVYLLRVLKKSQLHAWYFLIGSTGIFTLMMFLLQPILTQPLSRCVTALAGIIGSLTNTFDAYFKYGIIFIDSISGSMTLQIDFECSGIIEIMAFISLLLFFKVYTPVEKIAIGLGGFAYILLCNALRITIICLAVHAFGSSAYYVMHTFVGRIVFYILSVYLYFYVFTKPHIIQMKVGNFTYGHHKADC